MPKGPQFQDFSQPLTSQPLEFETGVGSQVVHLDIPGDVYVVRAERGHRDTLITSYDLSSARVSGATVPTWSDPATVIATYGLDPVVLKAQQILADLFGLNASLRIELESDPDSQAPVLVFLLTIRREQRALRDTFLDRYVHETLIPFGAPVPVLTWAYDSAVPA